MCDLGDKAWKCKHESNLKAKINTEGKRFQFTMVREIDVLKILKNLNTSKEAGIDNLPQTYRSTPQTSYLPRCVT